MYIDHAFFNEQCKMFCLKLNCLDSGIKYQDPEYNSGCLCGRCWTGAKLPDDESAYNPYAFRGTYIP